MSGFWAGGEMLLEVLEAGWVWPSVFFQPGMAGQGAEPSSLAFPRKAGPGDP